MFIFKKALQSLKAQRSSKMVLSELNDWQLFFEEKYGEENRADIMRTFIDFIIDQRHADVVIPGKCIAEGKVYSHESFKDGDRIFTPHIKRIFTIDKKAMICRNLSSEDESRFLVGIETIGGDKYWIDYLKKNEYMDRLEFDFVINRELSSKPGCYVPPCYERCGFL